MCSGMCFAGLAFQFGGMVHQDVAQRNQSFQIFAINNGQMAKSELSHDEQALLDAFVGSDGAGVGSHDLGHGGASGSAAGGDHAIHDVAFGEDARKFSIAQHGHRADVVLHHVARGFKHGARDFNRINFAVFHQMAESRH
jgi:hypothetical protein